MRERVAATPPADGEPLAEWVDRLLRALIGQRECPDDVTLLALRRRGR